MNDKLFSLRRKIPDYVNSRLQSISNRVSIKLHLLKQAISVCLILLFLLLLSSLTYGFIYWMSIPPNVFAKKQIFFDYNYSVGSRSHTRKANGEELNYSTDACFNTKRKNKQLDCTPSTSFPTAVINLLSIRSQWQAYFPETSNIPQATSSTPQRFLKPQSSYFLNVAL